MIQHTQKLLTRLEKSYVTWVLLAIAVIFFLLRLPSLFEPYWYGDEGIYQAIGDSLAHGRLLYVETWDNKPPLLYVVYALLSSDQFAIRLASALTGIASVFLLFILSRMLFKNSRIALILTGIFALLYATPLIEGIIANAENFIMIFVLLAALLLYKFTRETTFESEAEKTAKMPLYSLRVPKGGILSTIGLLLGIGFLFKIVAIFDLASFLFFLFIMHLHDRKYFGIPIAFVNQAKMILLGFFLPFALSVLYFLFHNALVDYISAAFFSNVGYVNYGNKLLIPQGLLIIKLVVLGVALLFLILKRRIFSPAQLFVLSWLAFSLFNAYFSQRPYTHYLLVLLPSFMLLLGLCLQKTQKRVLYVALFLFTLIFLVKDFDNFPLKKLVRYYGNFAQFVSGQKSVRDYQAFFDGSTPKYYDIATFLKSHTNPSDPVFIWGNVAQIYVLSDTLHTGKYTVAYHITGRKDAIAETNKAIEREKPKYIVVFDKPELPDISLGNYNYKLTIDTVRVYERIP